MNYPESSQILEEIKKADKILLNCHHNPDADSVGSALAMYHALTSINKSAKILCPNDLPYKFHFLPGSNKVETTDFTKFDFSEYDLFITLDSASWSRASGTHGMDLPNIKFIVIDHHKTNQKYGEINIIHDQVGSNSEIVYGLLQDWDIEVSKNIATCLLTGIIGDTGGFRYAETSRDTLLLATKLIDIGVNKDEIIMNLFQSYELSHIKVWAELLKNLKIDKEHKFIYSSMSKADYEKLGKPLGAKSELADMLFSSIEDSDFGWVAIEDNGYVSVSFRSRTGVDVSKIASILGGGGHRWAAAARIRDMNYEDAIQKILEESKSFASSHR